MIIAIQKPDTYQGHVWEKIEFISFTIFGKNNKLNDFLN